MNDLGIEQACFLGLDLRARSAGFRPEWLSAAARLIVGFGERPAGMVCPFSVFAQPLDRRHVAIVQVAEQAGGRLGFHFLVLPRDAYQGFGGDPFALAERAPADWQARGDLPTLFWPAVPLPARTVDVVRRVLQRPEGPSLLGGTQALLDGGRLVFVRSDHGDHLIRDLWQLLPSSTRAEIWPASFAFGNALRFHALVVPRADGPAFATYLTEDQAAEYPEGRYELSLQLAAEEGDQAELDALFSRRSRMQTWRLGVILFCLCLVLMLVMNWLTGRPR